MGFGDHVPCAQFVLCEWSHSWLHLSIVPSLRDHWKYPENVLVLKSVKKSMNPVSLILILMTCDVPSSVIDPTHVIGLYPDLLPSDYRKQLHYPNPLPTLSGVELERAHLALIDYLTQVCTHTQGITNFMECSVLKLKKFQFLFTNSPLFYLHRSAVIWWSSWMTLTPPPHPRLWRAHLQSKAARSFSRS